MLRDMLIDEAKSLDHNAVDKLVPAAPEPEPVEEEEVYVASDAVPIDSRDSDIDPTARASTFAPPPPPSPPPPSNQPPAPGEARPVPARMEPTKRPRVKEALSGMGERVSGIDTRWKVLAGIALTAIIVLLLAAIFREPPAPQAPVAPAAPAPEIPDAAPATTAPSPLQVATASALCGEGAGATPASRALSADPAEAWVCPRAHSIDGAILNITFKRPVTVSEIKFVAGFNYINSAGADAWNQHRVITRVLWRIGGQQYVQEIVPSREPAIITFDPPITTQATSMTILQSVEPDDVNATPLDATAVQGLTFIGN